MRRMAFRARASTATGVGSTLTTVDGEMVNRSELFDETDVDARSREVGPTQPVSAAAGEHGKPSIRAVYGALRRP